MSTETDVYELDAGQAKDSYRQLAELAAALAQNTTALSAQNALAATALESAAEAAKREAERLKESREETQRATEEKKKFSSMLKEDLNRALLSTAAQYDLMKEAVRGVIEIGRESVKLAAEEERANIRLANALKTAGYEGTAMLGHLSEMAEGFEQATNVSAETVKSIQELLVEFNVAPQRIEGLTQAILDYSAATGKDAVTAAKELIGAIRGESDSVGKLKLDLSGVSGEAARTDALVGALAKTMGGQSLTAAQGYSGEMASLHTNVENAEKALGRLFLAMEKSTGLLKAESEGLQGLVYYFSQEHDEETDRNKRTEALTKNLAEITRLKELLRKDGDRLFGFDKEQQERNIANLEKERVKLLEVRDAANKRATAVDGTMEPAQGPAFDRPKLDREKLAEEAAKQRERELAAAKKADEERVREEKRLQDELLALGRHYDEAAYQRQVEIDKKSMAEDDAKWKAHIENITAAGREEVEIEKRLADAIKKDARVRGLTPLELADALEQRQRILEAHAAEEASEARRLQDAIAKESNESLKRGLEEELKAHQEAGKAEIEEARRVAEEVESIREKQKKAEAQFRAEMVDIALQAINQVLGSEISAMIETATANQAYMAAMQERSVQRRQIELADQGVILSRQGIEAELAQEAEAADKKRLASTLTTIAQSAAIQALAMGAKAVERTVEYDYEGAASAGIAAGLYTAVAIAAGGAASAVNNSRGMTADEKSSLAAFDKRKDDAAKSREKKQGGQIDAGEGSGTSVNVYNFGITGQTRTAQGRELAKLQQEYGRGGVGGSGF